MYDTDQRDDKDNQRKQDEHAEDVAPVPCFCRPHLGREDEKRHEESVAQ